MQDLSRRTLGELLDAFLADCQSRTAAEDLSPETLKAYRNRARVLEPLRAQALSELTDEALVRWQRSLPSGRGVVLGHCAVGLLVAVLRYGRRHSWIDRRPEAALERRRPKRQPVHPLDADGLRALVARCRDEQRRRGRRSGWVARETAVAALVEALCFCGARHGGLRTLREQDVDFRERTMRLWTKGSWRTLPLSGPLAQLLARRAEMVRGQHLYLFPGAGDGPLSPSAAHAGFRRLAEGLGKARKPHELRHSFVRQSRRSGLSWRQIAVMVGHKDEAVTRDVYGEGALGPDSWAGADLFAADVLGEEVHP